MFKELEVLFRRNNPYDLSLASLFGICSFIFIFYWIENVLRLGAEYMFVLCPILLLLLIFTIFRNGIGWTRRNRVIILVSLMFSFASLVLLIG